jgi:hypothetical protein
VLLDDWVPRTRLPSREAALTELARRYVAAYGPATIEDLSAWSGLPMSEARSAVNGARTALSEVIIQARPGFVLKQHLRIKTAPMETDVRLLPAFDTYLLGYRRRDLAVPQLLLRRLQRGGGWIHPAVAVNGRAVGAWSLRKSGSRGGHLTIERFAPMSPVVRAGVAMEVEDVGRFLARDLRMKFTQRDVGSN